MPKGKPISETSQEVPLERAFADGHAELIGEGKSERIHFERKRADISSAEFTQSIEQACGNRVSLGAKY